MDRNERDRRRAAFSRPRQPAERDRSLAHGLELEDEAEREEVAHEPRSRRRPTGRFVAMCAIAVFVVSSIGQSVLMVDRFLAQAFMRDHGVVARAVILDKTYTARPPKAPISTYYVSYRFRPWPPAGLPAGVSIEGSDAVPLSQYDASSVGQTVTVRYNPQKLSQSMIYFTAPPTDRQMILHDALLVAVWVVLFGGVCAGVVAVAWPARPPSAGRVPKPWIYR